MVWSPCFHVIGMSQQLLSLLTHCGQEMCLDASEIVSSHGSMGGTLLNLGRLSKFLRNILNLSQTITLIPTVFSSNYCSAH